ncbi:glutathione peroxidase [Aquabacterium sp.]|uniref:glutathione peroxidase n=1 Tax=Aquabacterium sp. TaxID=1872578 RepID=UPI0035B3D8C9
MRNSLKQGLIGAAWVILSAATCPTLAAPACPAVLRHTLARLQDEKPQDLCQYAGQVVLVVNTASYCGFTPQYKGLEALYDRYRARGLVVLGFPSNDFAQEPGDGQRIAEFCQNTYGVKFPMFVKSSVRVNVKSPAPDANPLFVDLVRRTRAVPSWNFNKYLISRDGTSVAHYGTTISPDDAGFVKDIERLLSAPVPPDAQR